MVEQKTLLRGEQISVQKRDYSEREEHRRDNLFLHAFLGRIEREAQDRSTDDILLEMLRERRTIGKLLDFK